MKKIIVLLLALLLLPMSARAEFLRERIGAPEQVQAAFYSTYET